MKKITAFLGVFAALLCFCCMTAFAEATTGIYQRLMPAGTQQQLVPTFGAGAEQAVLYASDQPGIASVDEAGKVSAISGGLATITATKGAETVTYTVVVYSARMEAGTTQQLFSPISGVSYTSSDTDVAAVDGTGLVTAVGSGNVEITATSSTESFTYSIYVSVPVTDIDVGDYQGEMTVGTSQILSPAVIPTNATENTFSFSSENTAIATVNALGRVQAVAAGSVRIGVSCGGITRYCDITVVPKEDTTAEVTDLDIGDYESNLEVGKTLSLSVTALPATAANTAISYSSSNEAVATVNDNGRVTGVAVGSVTITAVCGKIHKEIPIKVVVKTTGITVDSTYLVMKPEETHRITATVTPSTAVQALTYSSLDNKIASVSAGGVIKAISVGSTTVMVSNGEQQAVITVIVNQNTNSVEKSPDERTEILPASDLDEFISKINNGQDGEEFWLNQKDMARVSPAILNALYGTDKTLKVAGDTYSIEITGRDIKNADNLLSTEVYFIATEQGMEFSLNEGNNLPGKIRIVLGESFESYCCLYLYNESLDKWQYLNQFESGTITVDTAGKYLLTEKKLNAISVAWWAIAGASSVVVIGVGIYIYTKKKYWFW